MTIAYRTNIANSNSLTGRVNVIFAVRDSVNEWRVYLFLLTEFLRVKMTIGGAIRNILKIFIYIDRRENAMRN